MSYSEVNILVSSFLFGKHVICDVSTFVSLQRHQHEDRDSKETFAKTKRCTMSSGLGEKDAQVTALDTCRSQPLNVDI